MRTDDGILTLLAEHSIEDMQRTDVLVVPGAPGQVAARAGEPMLECAAHGTPNKHLDDLIRRGSLILAAAGLRVADARLRTSWRWKSYAAWGRGGLRAVVLDGKLVTAADVSAGIDMALSLAARIAGEEVRSGDPARHRVRPPTAFDAGSPAKAPAEIVER